MASPWKFLARLVSPRRQQRQDDRHIDEVTPDILAIADPTDAPVIESLHIGEQPASERSSAVDQADAVSGEPVDERHGNVQDVAKSDSGKLGPGSDLVSLDGDVVAAKVEEPAGRPQVKRKARAKKNGVAPAVSQILPSVPSVSDGMVSLDEEIAVLRTELTDKLRLQNAQLKNMLARFG